MLAKVFSAAVWGVDAYAVEVEVNATYGKVVTVVVGLPDTAVKESAIASLPRSTTAPSGKHVRRNEQHNTDLRNIENSIPAAERGGLTIDQFCALQASTTAEADIRDKERQIARACFRSTRRQLTSTCENSTQVFAWVR
jgi:hypothetical protein